MNSILINNVGRVSLLNKHVDPGELHKALLRASSKKNKRKKDNKRVKSNQKYVYYLQDYAYKYIFWDLKL